MMPMPIAAHDAIEMAPDQETLSEVSVEDALSLALQAHRVGHLDDAEALYRRIIEGDPSQPDAVHFLGVLLHQRGKSEEAIELIEQSICLDPDQPNRYNNLGNVLIEHGKLAEATEAYQKAIALQPGHADAYNNLGAVLRAQRRVDEAFAAYSKAIELNPEHADAHNNFGNLLSSQGRVKEAMAYYCKAITLCPHHPESRRLLGIAYYTLGQIDAAANVYREWLVDEPNHPVALHLLAACSGKDVPARASDAYVETSFDTFAGSFDAKLERLHYRAPQLIADALAAREATPAKRLIALDVGCGTGLCGPLIAPYVGQLIGVDLSSQMLAKAQQRGVYDELVRAELTGYLERHVDRFDLIVSADTLVYFGPLEAVFTAAAGALRTAGLLIFTVECASETAAGSGYQLNPNGRYSHSPAYLSRLLRQLGFANITLDSAVLRTEGGIPVAGLVVACRKNGKASSEQRM